MTTKKKNPKHPNLNVGNPGNKGGGRKPDAFGQFCRELASSADVERELKKILKDRKDPKFVAALRYVTEYGYGKVPEQIDVTATHTHYVVQVPPKGADRSKWQQQYSQN